MQIIVGLFGMAAGALLIKYRERAGDMLGEPEWMDKIGGVYNVLIVVGVIIFFWSLAYMTGTLDILFGPLLNFLPFGNRGGAAPSGVIPVTEF